VLKIGGKIRNQKLVYKNFLARFGK